MRRQFLSLVALICGMGCAAPTVDSAPPEQAQPFTIAVLPDIQYVTLGYPELLAEMLQYVADNRQAENIVFVLQEGDISHNDTEAEYTAATEGFAVLGDLPWAVCIGNHDMTDGDTTRVNEAFVAEGYTDRPSFGGSRLAGGFDDHFHTFEAGGADWLILSLAWDPQDEALAWARGVLSDHAEHRAMVLTHAYLAPDGTRSSIGENIWEGLVNRKANVSLVLNGHYIDGEAARLRSEGKHGHTVDQLFVNFQDRPFGGAGLLRLMRFDPERGTIAVRTWSPMSDFALTDAQNEFLLEGVALGPL